MVIKLFVFLILLFSILSYFIPVENTNKKESNEDIAMLTFNDSTMYTLNTSNMNRIINAKKVLRFKSKDVMHKGSLILKSKDQNNKEITDILFSDIIIKRGDEFTFKYNVKYTRDNFISLNTNELLYNSKSKIAKNTLPFEGNYYNNYIKGENIYLDLLNYNMKSNNAHFEIEIEKK